MDAKKIVGIIFSILIIGAFGFLITWSVINFNKLEEAMSGTKIYDATDLDNAYKDGYNTALTNKEEYDELINSYRDTITSLNDNISQLNSDKSNLQTSMKDYQAQITTLTEIKAQNESTIANLNATLNSNNTTISGLNNQITNLTSHITNLENENNVYKNTIDSKNTLISNLQSQITILQDDCVRYSNTINQLNVEISSLKAEVNSLKESGANNDIEIANLNTRIQELEQEKSTIQTAYNNAQSTISSLNNQITSLNNEINTLTIEVNNKNNEIGLLNSQVGSLQTLVSQLQATNELNVSTIASLNSQISSLNSQVSELTLQIENNGASVSALNNRIKELEDSVAYYQNYIAGLESADTAVATFVFDGSVYNIQVVNKNSFVSVVEPTSTDYVIFNGWTVNGLMVDVSTYAITENITFEADVTHKYDVKFVVDNNTISSQIITENEYPTPITNPSKEGYEFDGWLLNNTITDVMNTPITATTNYVAKFTKLHTVTFTYEGQTLSTDIVRNGSYVNAPSVSNTDYKIFNGWKYNNSLVDLSTYAITGNINFVADITYRYDVNFVVDNATINTQIITSGQYPTLPDNPSKAGYEFDGWTTDGTNIVNPLAISVNANKTYIAKFTKLYTATFVCQDEVVSTQTVRENAVASNVSVNNSTYLVFNGWTINGEIVNVLTYPITKDTTFVASVTHKYNVNFIVDGVVHDSQIIANGSYATIPTTPMKQGYEFDGWAIDNTIQDVQYYQITNTTTFIAQFTKLHTVNFMYENDSVSTQSIRNGNKVTAPTITNTSYKVFNGWMLDNEIVDVSSLTITRDMTFVANITYHYDVQFMVQDSVYNTQLIKSGNFATVPSTPTISNYIIFDCWTVNGEEVDVATYPITKTTTFTAKLLNRYDVKFMVDNSVYTTQIVTSGQTATKPTNPELDNLTFVGWSVDGVDVVNVNSYTITSNTVFVGLFEEAQYTLTIIYNNGNPNTAVTQLPNTVYHLPIPSFGNYQFIEWRIAEGSGSLSGNVFTFGTSDATVYAVFNYCQTSIIAYTTGTVNYKGTNYTFAGQGNSGSIGGGGGSMTCSLDAEATVSPAAFIISPDFVNLACDTTDSLTITIDGGSLMLDITTDGSYTTTKISKTSYTISWTNASYISILVERNNVTFA